MASRRARKRGDKRDRYTCEPSPELSAALEQLSRAECLQPDTIQTKDGQAINLRKPWAVPGMVQR